MLPSQMLWGECISGALYVNDFLALARSVGFADPRELHVRPSTPTFLCTSLMLQLCSDFSLHTSYATHMTSAVHGRAHGHLNMYACTLVLSRAKSHGFYSARRAILQFSMLDAAATTPAPTLRSVCA